MKTDRQFLAAHIDDFRLEVLCDISMEDLFRMFDDRLELGNIILQRFNEFRRTVETDQENEQRERESERIADQRSRE